MRYLFCFVLLLMLVIVAQTAIVPAFLPPVLRPDLGIVVGMIALAFGPREYALVFLFALGFQADLFGSPRFGLLTLSYLLAAGLVLWAAWRELTRGDLLAAWIGAVAGTVLAHVLYLALADVCGLEVGWGQALPVLLSLAIAACVWALPCAYICKGCMFRLGVVAGPIRERWAAEARVAAARRGKSSRRGF